MGFIILSILLLLVTGVLVWAVKDKYRYVFYFTSILLSILMLISQSVRTLWKNNVYTDTLPMIPVIGQVSFVTLTINSLFLIWFALISLFSFIRFKNDSSVNDKYNLNYIFFLLIIISSISLITVNNSLFYAISLALFLAGIFGFVVYNYLKPENKKNILKYLFMQIFSWALVIFNILLLASITLSFNFSEYNRLLIHSPSLINITLGIMFFVLSFQLIFVQRFMKNKLFNNDLNSFAEFIFKVSNVVWIMNSVKYMYNIGNCSKLLLLVIFLVSSCLLFDLKKDKSLVEQNSKICLFESKVYIFILSSILLTIFYKDENSIVFFIFGMLIFLLADIISYVIYSLNRGGFLQKIIVIPLFILSRVFFYIGLFFFMFKEFPVHFIIILSGLIIFIKSDIKLLHQYISYKNLKNI